MRLGRSLLGFSCLVLLLPGLAPAKEGAWSRQVLQGVRESEYHFKPGPAGDSWTAPNRAQNLRSTVGEAGWRLQPRAPRPDFDWSILLRLDAVGRGDDLAAVAPANSVAGGNRLDREAGWGVEWFVNEPRGVEHGFTIRARPEGAGAPLVLELTLGGTVEPRLDGGEITFVAAGERPVLRYGKLLVFDDAGAVLPARFDVRGDRLRIVVDDAGAVYPVVVDPLATIIDWVGEVNQAGAEFGAAVASAGDVNNDGYDDIIVGADEYDNGQFSEGAVFVFHGGPFGPSATPDWSAESDQLNADFGIAVASAGDVNGDGFDDVIVGAHRFENGEFNEGAAFVFHGSATGLDQNGTRPLGTPSNADWFAEGQQQSADLGISVASAGDVNDDGFDDVIVGADEYRNGHSLEGIALVFHGSATGLDQNGTRPQGTPANADWLGESDYVDGDYGFAIAGGGDLNGDGIDDVVVGAWNFDETELDEGKVYAYFGSPAGLSTTPDWTILGEQDVARLGIGVAIADFNGDGFGDVVAGADAFDSGQLDEGAVVVFFGSQNGPSLLPGWLADSDQGASNFGFRVANAGDLNGDGIDDIIVGAPRFDNGELDEGKVFVYLGAPGLPSLNPAYEAEGNQAGAQYGWSVGAGDFNGDGLNDVVVGAKLFDKPETDEGIAISYFGCSDVDRDGICAADDNCPDVANNDQADTDGDGVGDLCDECSDLDGDDVCDEPIVLVQGQGPGEEVLVEFGSSLTYLDNTSNPGLGTDWTLPGFVEGPEWQAGSYGVGYELDSGAENLLQTIVAPHSFSVYTRVLFDIPDVNAVENMFVGADYDDAYVVWINGVEVFRSPEMPAGTPVYNTDPVLHESSNRPQPDYGQLQDISFLALPALVNGQNLMAVGVWNGLAANSSDLVLVPRLSINRSDTTAVSYFANSAQPPIPGMTWTDPSFSVGVWPRGNYGVGYEAATGAENLINTDTPAGLYSIYTRTNFNVAVGAVRDLRIGADYDDGWAAWINGTEVYRSPEMPGGALAWDSNPADHESSNGPVPDYGVLQDVTGVALGSLNSGANVLAVGVWNSGGPASDDLVVVPRLELNGLSTDNCIFAFNPDQIDTDGDGAGDACDLDDDDDGIADVDDNCRTVQNPSQDNLDGDLLGDACDSCPDDANNDVDGDGYCDGTLFAAPKVGAQDNCPTVANPDQADLDLDGEGDACDSDVDGDMVDNDMDNCPLVMNAAQANADGDVNGDACDCDSANNQVWQRPEAVVDLAFGGETALSWSAPADLGATSALYDVLRSGAADDFGAVAVCLESDEADTTAIDATVPAPGDGLFYLIRVENACPVEGSNMGTDSAGNLRTGRTCPFESGAEREAQERPAADHRGRRKGAEARR